MTLYEEILRKWADFRLEVETIDSDMHKSLAKENVAAGRRARGKFRSLRKQAMAIIKDMVTLEKVRETEAPASVPSEGE
jgi:hypothetical protein